MENPSEIPKGSCGIGGMTWTFWAVGVSGRDRETNLTAICNRQVSGPITCQFAAEASFTADRATNQRLCFKAAAEASGPITTRPVQAIKRSSKASTPVYNGTNNRQRCWGGSSTSFNQVPRDPTRIPQGSCKDPARIVREWWKSVNCVSDLLLLFGVW